MIKLDTILAIVFGVMNVVAFYWAWKERQKAKEERQRHRDFKNKVVGWQASVNGIAHACTSLEEDCEGDKISSVEAAGEAVKMIALIAHPLDASMKAALKMSEETKR